MGNRGPRFIGAIRREQSFPIDTLLKRPTREPWPPARLRPGGDSAPEGGA
ncbi:MAG: hypothetical protein ACQEQO_09020 [Thermodesulfobacteriota bacterium]